MNKNYTAYTTEASVPSIKDLLATMQRMAETIGVPLDQSDPRPLASFPKWLPPFSSPFVVEPIVSPFLEVCDRVQVRFPRSKKRRIRKKWAKRSENYTRVPRDVVWQFGNTLYMSPATLRKIERTIMRKNESRIWREVNQPGALFIAKGKS